VSETSLSPHRPYNDELIKERREYSFNVTQTDPKTKVIAQIAFSVTEEDVDVYENGQVVRSVLNVRVVATNGPQAQFKLDQNILDSVAAPAAKAIIEKSIEKGFDKALALGIAAKETLFGTAPGTADRAYNPMQYRTGLPGVRVSQDMNANVGYAMDLYGTKEKLSRSKDPMVVLDWYRGRGIQPSYPGQVMAYRTEVQSGMQAMKISSYLLRR
jgi:hypothetical protein